MSQATPLRVAVIATLIGVVSVTAAILRWSPPPPVVVRAVVPPPPAPAPVAPALPPLQEIQVKDVPTHAVPEESIGRSGHPLDLSQPDRSAAGGTHYGSSEVENGAAHAPAPAPPLEFVGAGRPTGPAGLLVGSQPVQLYGIQPPKPGDHCGSGPCAAAAQAALADKLKAGAKLSCHTPHPRAGSVVAFAICLDNTGLDLGSFLVGEGLATADTGQSYDYVSAEATARSQKHGLWQFR